MQVGVRGKAELEARPEEVGELGVQEEHHQDEGDHSHWNEKL